MERRTVVNQVEFPPPQDRPDSLGDGPYDEVVRFSRGALLGWCLIIFGITAFASRGRPLLPPIWAVTIPIAIVLFLTAVRRGFGGTSAEKALSLVGLAALVPFGAELVAATPHLPWWSVTTAATLTLLYLSLCGRDLSFAGLVWLGSIGATLLVFTAIALSAIPRHQALSGWLSCIAVLFYLGYDMGMILRRRKSGEMISAVADLFRDLLNWITYPIRIAIHWSRYRFDPFPGGGQ